MSRKTRQNTEVDLEDLEKILPYISDTKITRGTAQVNFGD